MRIGPAAAWSPVAARVPCHAPPLWQHHRVVLTAHPSPAAGPSPVASEHVISRPHAHVDARFRPRLFPQSRRGVRSNVCRCDSPMALSRFRLSATRPSLWGSHDSTSLSLAWSSNAAVARARHVRSCRRGFHVAPILIPPLMFGGLFVALWTWKCAMMVLCQNMIIYNPFLPPNARSMRIADYAKDCGGIQWREERIRSLDGTEIALCVSDVLPASDPGIVGRTKTPVYILYFQGLSLSKRKPCCTTDYRF